MKTNGIFTNLLKFNIYTSINSSVIPLRENSI